MDSPHGAAVKAEDFGMKGPRGWVFRGVGIDAAPGSLIAVEGPSGSGRTCLLLALTGRMKPTEGHAEIGRHRLPKKMAAVRRIAALGPVPGVNDLDQALSVAEQLREGALLQRRYDGPVRALLRPRGERRASTAARIDAALGAAGLDVAALPKGPRTSVRDLERLESVRLSVAIALLGSPRLLAVDDLDLKLSDAERAEAWDLLRSLAARGTTVLAVCSEAPSDATVLRTGPEAAATAPAAEPADPPAEPTADPAGGSAVVPRPMDSEVTWGAEATAPHDSDGNAGSDADTGSDAEAGTSTDTDTSTDTGADADTGVTAAAHDPHDTKGDDDALAEAGRA
ncbi:ATP-binding cassette domain-containing protein [Streptomyces sp. NPDC006487]|uniref:ATP-binding cassette domain-containing protein n=1 Tax=Streptomyces sp. NPDC006487 TaxID=3364748 RepID=UPI00367CA9FA